MILDLQAFFLFKFFERQTVSPSPDMIQLFLLSIKDLYK